MPFRLDPDRFPGRTKVQFTTWAKMPMLIYRACQATGTVSNTVYIQHAVAAALARDLAMPLEEITAHLPTPRASAAHLWAHDATGTRIGPANTVEEVR